MAEASLPGRGALADCKQAPGILRPVIDRNQCEGKGPCVAVCPEHAITLARA